MTMRKIGSMAAGIAAVTLLAAASATPVFAQAGVVDKTTRLTFSKPVQVPGTTLPAGTYVFRIANPAAQTLWQVFDENGRHLLASFFYVPTRARTISEVNSAHNKPIVRFHETTQGVPPAVRVLYYPTDLAGNEFLYPKEQAEKIAAVSHHPVLAFDNDPARGGVARVITVEPPAGDAASQ
jgi:hypothetical protein